MHYSLTLQIKILDEIKIWKLAVTPKINFK